MKGKWAQGLAPRHFAWVIRDRLAVCERIGGHGASHRRVRRAEEIVWVKAQGFTCVVSTMASPHNLHAYDEAGLPVRHLPLAHDDVAPGLESLLTELRHSLVPGARLLLHDDDVGDRVQGLLAGYLVHAGLVPEPTRAVAVLERLLQRPMGPPGRELVALAQRLVTPSAES
ncbi:MAG: hypothetical protein M3P97_06335 [Actinomycetota bacterium]|nr:hypothetical protein [Actinomycetota bacterium]